MSDLVRTEARGDVLVVWNTNTSRRNALSPEYYAGLVAALARAGPEPGIAAIVLAGEGGFFCSGGDLNLVASRAALPEAERRERIEALHDVIRAIRACPVPVVAAVDGGAAGAGVSLAFACDLVVAAADATFTVAYVKAGLVPDGGLTHTLGAHVPPATLMRLMLTGDPIEAVRLNELGALSVLAAPGFALSEALALAERLADGPREAQAAIKALVAAAGLERQLDAERDAMARAQGGPEAAEGIAAFLGKRRPDFRKAEADV